MTSFFPDAHVALDFLQKRYLLGVAYFYRHFYFATHERPILKAQRLFDFVFHTFNLYPFDKSHSIVSTRRSIRPLPSLHLNFRLYVTFP